ncbi:CHAT domain-containing protein [Tychonema sp. BBK16]|uniref:CHAT domain-containing protein n=1 Tax=Tychonema sp. BBK16 TaxID=2699888 RepID=UPI0038D2DE9C
MIVKYLDFLLVADNVHNNEEGELQRFSVRVPKSPAGEQSKVESQSVEENFKNSNLRRLENRKLDNDGIIDLGEKLANVLLPKGVRNLLISSIKKLQPDEGLRLRLILDPSLTSIPWEYLYIAPEIGPKDSTGFLALDPRISIVRHEILPIAGELDSTPKVRRLLVALASSKDEPLDIAKECSNIKSALKDVPGIEPDFVQDATSQQLFDKLITRADIFHFAGHGIFNQVTGKGEIVLLTEDGNSAPMPAENLALILRGAGVQLAVFGACETGRRNDQNVWGSVVTALMNVGIPASVAMQYKIQDESAIAFSRSFYQALAAGLPLDGAVSAGRRAVFLCNSLKDEKLGRDWGVPVLYWRAEGNFVLSAMMDESQRKTLLDELQAGSNGVQNLSGGVNNSGTMKHSPVIQGNENVLQSGKYNIYTRTANGPVAIGDNSRIVNPTFGNVTNSPIGVAGGNVTIGDVIYGTEKTSDNDVRSLFNSILDRVSRRPADPDVGNDEIIQNVEWIRNEVLLGREANLKKIERWLKYLEVAPEIQEAVVITLERHHPDITEPIRQLATSVRR